MTLSNLDILFDLKQKLPDTLAQRRERGVGLEGLVIQSCRVHSDGEEAKLKELVGKVAWEDVTEMGSDYEASEESEDDTPEAYMQVKWAERLHPKAFAAWAKMCC